jgi:hypothetical protein
VSEQAVPLDDVDELIDQSGIELATSSRRNSSIASLIDRASR